MRKLTNGYVNYLNLDGSYHGIKLATFKGINITNAYKTDYNRYVANAINFVIARFIYFGKRKNQTQSSVIITDKELSKFIGCSRGHAHFVFEQLKTLFNLEYTRAKYRGGARTISLSLQLIDFMKSYTDEDFNDYIDRYNINESDIYALKQVHEYIMWNPTSSQLSLRQQNEKKEFMYDHNDYYHYVATSNMQPEARIKLINKHQDKLNEVQRNQLKAINEEMSPGKKLRIYLHRVLVKLEQKITSLLFHEKDDQQNTNEETHSNVERNTTPGETVAHESATHKAQRLPEEDSAPRTYIKLAVLWNYLAIDNAMPLLKAITRARKQSIDVAMRNYTEKEILQAVKRIKHLDHNTKYQYKMKFERFIQSETIQHLLELNPKDHTGNELDFMNGITNMTATNKLISEVPEFNTLKEANTWLRTNS